MEAHWTVVDYSDGAFQPIRDFIAELEPAERGRLKARLEMVRLKGLVVGSNILCKVVGGKRDDPRRKLWELRLPKSMHNPRFLLAAVPGRTLVLLHGFKKIGRSNDKIPESDIQLAVKRMLDYLERQEGR